ncbi:uncharacterized protein L203_103870 [Cryptococcus depauperatus CBS 7841]|uniref:Uncharacterized protein n=1 Tax=Cryptococcus depauperatus CBS 7841 TaxID=1295531 RepID=A0A1E3HLY2_9TREE|nr:hypothetical protein L203_06409 [Cryptococcus depauperatus CBS 7841]
MDRTLEESFDEDDSLFSVSQSQTHHPVIPSSRPSFQQLQYIDGYGIIAEEEDSQEEAHYQNASAIQPDGIAGDSDNGNEGVEDQEETYDEVSDGSSDLYDPDADPESFAQRLDELAGVLEMGEVEARSMRYDPPVAKDHRQVPNMPPEEFKMLVRGHIANTAWQYPDQAGSFHPIRVMGKLWRDRDEGFNNEEPQEQYRKEQAKLPTRHMQETALIPVR